MPPSVSLFDLFTIGIGPSSSHTVGPMRAARGFAAALAAENLLGRTERVTVEFFGSLGLTGRGHGSDKAVILGLQGLAPETVDPDAVEPILKAVRENGTLPLDGKKNVSFDAKTDLVFYRDKNLSFHSNAMAFKARDGQGAVLKESVRYSTGGGAVVAEEERGLPAPRAPAEPYPYASCAELLEICRKEGLKIHAVMLANEAARRGETAVREGLAAVWRAMQDCVARGCRREGVLPGGLKVPRRAPELFRKLSAAGGADDPLAAMDWVDLWALAVGEENASGSRVVTAPTNGAAGIIPAVLHYLDKFHSPYPETAVFRFLLTAGAIGSLYKRNASISGAEVGCQGEIGVACSMAAAGLAEALGGSNAQIENAAEIGMEHNLGLTCDPVGGLVQIPCIERNAMGAVKAINAARIALRGDGTHKIPLDKAIKTMLQTGLDMRSQYKETAQGGLAANVVEC